MPATPTTPALTLFSLDQFDWREIAASHPAGCVCMCCEAAFREPDAYVSECERIARDIDAARDDGWPADDAEAGGGD
jgi:hypothetical protein